MTATLTRPTKNSQTAILDRLLRGGRPMSAALARHILTLGFDADDQSRMGELAERNQAGQLNADERDELAHYVSVGHLLAVLQSQARQALRRRT